MLARIEHLLPTLSPAEARVGRWLLDHPRQGLEATLAEVAAGAGTSEPTVVRFCRRLGLGGFRELRIRLAESLGRPADFVHRGVLPNDSAADAVGKVIDSAVRALMGLRDSVGLMPIAEIVEVMADARQIVFAGLGASGYVARDARQKFFRLGIPCAVATDGPTILQSAAIAGPQDVFVFVSHTGAQGELIRAAVHCRKRGATVIAVTRSASALGWEAGYILESHSTEDTSLYTPMESRLAQLAILDAVQVSLALRLGEAGAENLRAAKMALADEGAAAGIGRA
ncbi:MurR/RpiR family transcriptional regulator [Lentisalinibacter sediminis]|uniref:MurR/RpiR family transcriptional regulator n=1 Tax=Lentisalinibacter sediminis TaxID=2992237 RepID=UPI00386D5B9C